MRRRNEYEIMGWTESEGNDAAKRPEWARRRLR